MRCFWPQVPYLALPTHPTTLFPQLQTNLFSFGCIIWTRTVSFHLNIDFVQKDTLSLGTSACLISEIFTCQTLGCFDSFVWIESFSVVFFLPGLSSHFGRLFGTHIVTLYIFSHLGSSWIIFGQLSGCDINFSILSWHTSFCMSLIGRVFIRPVS